MAVLALGFVAPLSAEVGPAVFMIGDSTMADKPVTTPEWGWGQAFRRLFVDPAIVQNHAKNGRSSKSFRDEGLWEPILAQAKPGDFLIIQFSHNDQKPDVARATDPATTFRQNLVRFIREFRAKGGHPIVATPVCRRKFDEQGLLVDTHGRYPEAIRAVAQEESIPLLDLQTGTAQWLQRAGPEASKVYFMWLEPGRYRQFPEGNKDDTHFVEAGAETVARLAAAELRARGHPIAKWLKE